MLSSLQNSRANLDQYFNENFVELKDPLNQYGRKIYVEKNAARSYDEIMASRNTDFNHLYIYKQIASLKGIGTLSSYLSTKTVLSRMLPLEGGQILYSVWHGRVYITEIRIQADYKISVGKRNVPAGVYPVVKAESGKDAWRTESHKAKTATLSNSLKSQHLAINGHCKDIAHAANYMPKFIKHGHGESSIQNRYDLFFNPCQGFVSGDWKAFLDSTGLAGTQASHKLAAIFTGSAKQEEPVYITVHEAGHALFQEALRKVHQDGTSLENYTVYYANATSNLTRVDHWRERVGMKLAKKKPLINSYSAQQALLSGNAVSAPIIAGRADPENKIASFVDGASSAAKPFAVAAGAAALSASWAWAVLPYALGQGRSSNTEVLDSAGKVVQHRVKQTKKLIWDPIHKMMVRA